LGPHVSPPVDRTGASEAFDGLDTAVERDPRHHLRVREVALAPAHLPDPLIRLLPRVLEVSQYPALKRPRLLGHLQVVHTPLMERVEHLAVDVELELSAGRVADAHRLRFLVAREPVEREFRQTPLAGDAVHDLQRGRIAGRSAEEPDAPG